MKDFIRNTLDKTGLDGFKTYLMSQYSKYLFSDEQYIRREFKKRLGREVNLENPKKFNDKLQWLKLNWRNPLATKCSDKYRVREYVKDKVGEEILNELHGVYESVDEINLDELPESFVLKATHASGFNIICRNKEEMNWNKQFRRMRWWLKTNYHYLGREWVYKDIKPRIICEKYLSDEEEKPPKDYKIFCFNGEPKIICVDFDKYKRKGKIEEVVGKNEEGLKTGFKRNVYDLDWNFLDKKIAMVNDPSTEIPKPRKLDRMINLAKHLSNGFPQVRVDFYTCNSRVFFGELTFFDTSGFAKIKPEEFELKMGEWLGLP